MVRPRPLTAEQVSTVNWLLEQARRGYSHAHALPVTALSRRLAALVEALGV